MRPRSVTAAVNATGDVRQAISGWWRESPIGASLVLCVPNAARYVRRGLYGTGSGIKKTLI